ncbi:MAG: beta-ketoacyl-ACP reductase [Phycisphaerae bacterium]|nr:MAG: 3-oxoacyl-[acyl-carrier-protein] reductase [Planctomycetia bacterium]RIK71511.1 MAG: 3-oxoacyl-[acyl-carrier-protein] reductase [Planctomycetota bacterium]GJQ25886.1 MAG: beta-ketoacyl-ACP reductase [Phycisphaerae bacterium]
MADLIDRVAIVTGGSRGIGRATSLALAKAGATVVACARNTERLGSLSAEAADARCIGKIVSRALDVTDAVKVEKWIDDVATDLGRIDILVNNAGITRDGLLMNMTDEQFDEVLNTNLRSVFLMTRAASKYMVRARWGRIINITSISGVMGNAGQANYAASKAGVIGLTKSVAKELARRGVTCNAIAPGFINTDMTSVLSEKVKEQVRPLIPLQRFGEPEEVAAAVAFLASPAAGYINGQILAVDGGLRM